MTIEKTIRRTQERKFAPHLMLISASRRSCEAAAQQKPGWFYDALATMTLSALAIEALCNSIGEVIVPKNEYDEFERFGPTNKLKFLAQRLGIAYNQQKAPWAAALWLIKFRNAIAHAKPELVKEDRLMSEQEHDKREFDTPASWIEQEITVGNAKRALCTVEALKDLMLKNMDAYDTFGLAADGWIGSSKLQPGASDQATS